MRKLALGLTMLVVTACGRDVAPDEVKLVGVGFDPEEIGPAPTAYGGVVEYNHIDFAGGGVPFGVMGIGGNLEVTSDLAGHAPPYEGLFGFSYIFDTKLSAGDTFNQNIGVPPAAEDSCYTVISPRGPIGTFTTVDVGDYQEFVLRSEFDARQPGERMPQPLLRLGRDPRDFPPRLSDLSVYYIGFTQRFPSDVVRRTYQPTIESQDPNTLDATGTYRRSDNFPFGEEVVWNYPGGLTTVKREIGSLPLPATATEPAVLPLPNEIGPVSLSWQGPRYTYLTVDDVWVQASEDAPHTRCFEFFEDAHGAVGSWEDCAADAAGSYPSTILEYRNFKGQLYTGPWETTDGEGVTFEWEPATEGSPDYVMLSLRWMERLRPDPIENRTRVVPVGGGDFRSATTCELWDDEVSEWQSTDPVEQGEDFGTDLAAATEPFSRLVEVVCLLADDGEYTLTTEPLQQALAYAASRDDEVGGVLFMLARGTEIEAEVPAVKDQFDFRRDITPVRVASHTIRAGRFHWNEIDSADGGTE